MGIRFGGRWNAPVTASAPGTQLLRKWGAVMAVPLQLGRKGTAVCREAALAFIEAPLLGNARIADRRVNVPAR